MKTTLTQAQIDQYRRDGALLVEDFLTAQELSELRAAVTVSVEAMGQHKVASNPDYGADTAKNGADTAKNGADTARNRADDQEFYESVFLQRLNLWTINDTVKAFFTDPALGTMMAQLEGVDGYRIWHDQTLQKMPWGNATAWHLDNPYWSFFSHHAISIWIALDDATTQNGCMYYLPGTHKTAEFERNVGIGRQAGELFRTYPEWKTIEPICGAMKAGSCGFHNGLTAHGAGTNMTPRPRRAMTCAYMPVGSTFNGQKNILPTDYFESLRVGDVLDNDRYNPRVG